MTKNKKCIKSIGFRVQKHVEEVQKHVDDSNLPLDIIHLFNHSKIPPWELIKPDIDISLNPLVFKQKIGRNKTIQTSCNRNLY